MSEKFSSNATSLERYNTYGDTYSTAIIDERISFLKEQINQENKSEVNKTFQVQIYAIRSIDDDIEKVESILNEKKALLKKSKDVYESDRLFAELDALEWLQRQIAVYS